MNNLIERYIYDVTRRLPENERDEVSRELEANIADMLPDDPGEQDIIDVLTKLGSPMVLAEQYRQKPRYLISPAMFELYITVLKIVVLIVGVVCLCVGVVMAVFSSGSVGEAIGSAVGLGIEGALQAAMWVTIGFVIAERAGFKEKPWTVNDLPRLPEQTDVKISRSSSIVGLILSVFFPILIIMMIVRNTWFFVLAIQSEVIIPFSQAALDRLIPYLIIFGALGVVMGVMKLVFGRWNVRLCIANIIQNVIWLSLVLYILRWPYLLSDEMTGFVYRTFADDADILGFIQSGGIVVFFSVVFIAAALIDIGTSIWKTWKGRK
jgi:hypothetical protein